MKKDTRSTGVRAELDVTAFQPPLNSLRIDEICDIVDDLYRNRQITYAYAVLSLRLAHMIDGPDVRNANWFTFARWSSFTVGENLRLDQPSEAFDELLSDNRVLRTLRSPATRIQHDLRMLSDAAMPRTLALGNQLVFHEIAFVVAQFVEWCETNPKADEADWAEHRAGIAPGIAVELFPACEIDWLRDGVEAYFRAMREPDPTVRARLVLRGNVLLAAYEQKRLEPIVTLALDPIAKHLVMFCGTDLHNVASGPPRVEVRRPQTEWALRHRSPIDRWIVRTYAALLTRYVMAWQGPVIGQAGSLFLGRGLPDRDGRAPCAPGLDAPHDRWLDVMKTYDRSNGTPAGRAARNWVTYEDRMNFIVNLFRSEQADPELFDPLTREQLHVIDLDLRDAALESLRSVGDQPVDDAIDAHCNGRDLDPRALVHELVQDNFAALRASVGPSPLPLWADHDQMVAGQQFMLEHGLEIGSALFFASLPMTYTAARGARVLTRTAELLGSKTTRRLAETGQMLLDLMHVDEKGRLPLTEGTASYNAVQGVRLFHGAVRHMIKSDPHQSWNTKHNGTPINQEDLLGTLIVFTVVVVDALETMGVDFGDPAMVEAREAYVHYWLVVGHLLGIRYGALRFGNFDESEPPFNLEELRMLKTAIFRRQIEKSDEGSSLSAALIASLRQRLPWFMLGYPNAATRVLLGKPAAEVLGVPNSAPGRVIFDAVRVATRLISPRAPGRGLAAISRWSTVFLYRDWIDKREEGHFPPWRLVPAANWGLKRTGNPDREPPGPASGPAEPTS